MVATMEDLKNDLMNACMHNQFPSLNTMSHFGLNCNNPVDVLSCYKEVFKKQKFLGNTSEQINETFRNIIPQHLDFYKRVMKNGGIQISSDEVRECSTCCYNGIMKCNHE
jgi:hypothetical protein